MTFKVGAIYRFKGPHWDFVAKILSRDHKSYYFKIISGNELVDDGAKWFTKDSNYGRSAVLLYDFNADLEEIINEDT